MNGLGLLLGLVWQGTRRGWEHPAVPAVFRRCCQAPLRVLEAFPGRGLVFNGSKSFQVSSPWICVSFVRRKVHVLGGLVESGAGPSRNGSTWGTGTATVGCPATPAGAPFGVRFALPCPRGFNKESISCWEETSGAEPRAAFPALTSCSPAVRGGEVSAILPSAWRVLGLNISVHSCLKVLGSTRPPAEALLRTPQQRRHVQGAVCCCSQGRGRVTRFISVSRQG